MAGYGKGAAPLTSQTSFEKRTYIDERAARLNWSRAEVIGTIVDFWFAMGAPALSELDAHAPKIPIPADCREPLHPWWAQLVAFEAKDDVSRPTAKGEAERLLNRAKKAQGARASGESNHSARK